MKTDSNSEARLCGGANAEVLRLSDPDREKGGCAARSGLNPSASPGQDVKIENNVIPNSNGAIPLTSGITSSSGSKSQVADTWGLSAKRTHQSRPWPSQDSQDMVDTGTMRFLQVDYQQTSLDYNVSRQCRASLFPAIIIGLGAVGVGVLSIVGATKRPPMEEWLPWALLIPIALLVVAMLVTIYKARQMTMRKGYLRRLAECLLGGECPQHYSGWHGAVAAMRRCNGVGRTKTDCVQPACLTPHCTKTCFDEAARLAADELGESRQWPGIFDDFTSLTMYLYSTAFVISVVLLLYAIMLVSGAWAQEFSRRTYVFWLFASVPVTTALLAAIVYLAPGAKLNPRRLRALFSGVLFLIVTAFFVLLMYVQTKGTKTIWGPIVAYAFGCDIMALTVAVGYESYLMIRSLHHGALAAASWYWIWAVCFSQCPHMDPKPLQGETGNMTCT